MIMYSMDEIIQNTGISVARVNEICNVLSQEGYLIFDKESGKFRLTEDESLMKNIRKMWSQCQNDEQFEQMANKIEDIMEFGKPLALGDKGPGSKVRDIGCPGLNIIFGNLDNNSDNLEKDDMPRIPGLPKGHCLLIKGAPGTGKTTLGMQIALHLKKYRARFLTFEEDIEQLLDDFNAYICIRDRKKRNPNDSKNIQDKYLDFGWQKESIKEVTRSLAKIRTPQAWEKPDKIIDELTNVFDRELPYLVVIDSVSRFRDLGGEEKARMIFRRVIRSLKCRKITAIFTAEDRQNEFPFEDYEVDSVINLEWIGDTLTLGVKKIRGMKAYKGPHTAALMGVEEFISPLKKGHNSVSQLELQEVINNNKYGDLNKSGKGMAPHLTVGLNVFPYISIFNEETRDTDNISLDTISIESSNESGNKSKGESDFISTGTTNLDDLLLSVDKNRKGFKIGETILLVGSAGAGKTLLALNFMLEGYKKKENLNETNKRPDSSSNSKKRKKLRTVWLNFEGDMQTLKFAVDGFSETLREPIIDMLNSSNSNIKDNGGHQFNFVDFPPINLDLNKIVFILESLDKTLGIDRLVIDSITELERAKGGGQPVVKVFLAGLIQFLRKREITTLFVCRSDAFFRSIDKIEEQVSSLVDLIICIRNFDIHNQIQKGIYIQKARGRKHNSKIMRLIIDTNKGLSIEDSGWDLENLLAGDTSNISNPRIFFKLFYENPAEEYINKKIIKDFDEHRYPGEDPKFSLVKKPNIYTEFWSFRGQYSAGHANTRVLSIPDHILTAFRDNNRLANLDKYVKSEVLQNIESEEHLKFRYTKRDRKEKLPGEGLNEFFTILDDESGTTLSIDALPCYRDYGVMVFNEFKKFKFFRKDGNSPWDKYYTFLKDWTTKLNKRLKNHSNREEFWISKSENSYTLDHILDKLIEIEYSKDENPTKKKFRKDVPQCKQVIYPFAMPPLDEKSEFVAFFMEILWSYGGDFYKSSLLEKLNPPNDVIKFEPRIEESIFKELINYCIIEIEADTSKKSESTNIENISEENISLLMEVLAWKKPIKEELLNEREKKITKILNILEQRFIEYGFKARNIEWISFKEWLLRRLNEHKENIFKKNSMLLLNGMPFQKTIELLLKFIFLAKVKNPGDGEFRNHAVLSRNWYSRISYLYEDRCNHCAKYEICEFSKYAMDKKNETDSQSPKIADEFELLPIPLAESPIPIGTDNKIYRSVSCITYWSLVMLNNALSPEIGGNFIESLSSPEYYEERLKYRLGMPVFNWELSKERYSQYDKKSYHIFRQSIENDNLRNKLVSDINNFFKGKTPGNINLEDLNKEIKSKTDENMYAFNTNEFLEYLIKIDSKSFQDKDLDVKRNQHMFYTKIRQRRTAYYQLENTLHFQLKLLFERESFRKYKQIYSGKSIYDDIKKFFDSIAPKKKSKSKPEIPNISDNKKWKEIISKIEKEFRFHMIFELLSYFYMKSTRGAEPEKKNE